MSSLNQVNIIGRLGQDPETRSLQTGTQVANFSVATTESYKNQSGQLQKDTEWHRVVAFGKLAETCARYLSKGKLVYIGGRLKTKNWEDRDGNKRHTTEIIARELRMLSSAPRSQGGPTTDDDDVPF